MDATQKAQEIMLSDDEQGYLNFVTDLYAFEWQHSQSFFVNTVLRYIEKKKRLGTLQLKTAEVCLLIVQRVWIFNMFYK